MFLAAGFHRLERRDVLGHDHHLGAGHLLDQGVAFLVIAVRVVPEQNLDVGELEPQIRDRLLDRSHVPLVGAVDEDVAGRRHDEERAERLRPHVVDVAHDLVGRELRRLVIRRPHVARQDRPRRIRLPLDGDRRMVGRTILCVS